MFSTLGLSSLDRRYSAVARIGIFALAAFAITFAVADSAPAQQKAASTAPKGYRKLGPGVETIIPAKPDPQDTVTQHDMVEIQSAGSKLDWKPETQAETTTLKVLTKDIPFRRGAWYLDFAFKPLRMIDVEIPRTDGRMERRKIWYMVYRVKNLGQHLEPDSEGGKNENVANNPPTTEEIYFRPQFILASPELKKEYLDRSLPLAVDAIQQREDPKRKLLDSVQIGEHPIPLSTPTNDRSVWGVATWEYIDPQIDFFNLYVKGLSNAYRFADPKGAYKPNEPPGNGRIIVQKTLKLSFWRPGDTYDPNEGEIFYGIPGQVDHEWVFR